MNPSSSSLLSFLDAPVVVADPEGKTVYMNPAFAGRFRTNHAEARGTPLATLFEGGDREAVLESVAQVCQHGRSIRFRVRERGVGFAAVASPITAEGAHVGVLLLLLEEAVEEERLLAFHREIQEPVDAVARCFEELLEQTGGRRAERFRGQVEAGMKATERLRRWTSELHALVTGRAPAATATDRFDPVRAVRDAVASVAEEAASAQREIELLVPAELPAVKGDGGRCEAALSSLLRDRVQRSPASSFTLAAKAVGQRDRAAVLVSLSEAPAGEACDQPPGLDEVPPLVAKILNSLGASLRTTDDPVLGRTTAIRFPIAT